MLGATKFEIFHWTPSSSQIENVAFKRANIWNLTIFRWSCMLLDELILKGSMMVGIMITCEPIKGG